MTFIWSTHVRQADICREGLILCLAMKRFAFQCERRFLTVSKRRSVLPQMIENWDDPGTTLSTLHFRKRFSTYQLHRTMLTIQQQNQRLDNRSIVRKFSPHRHTSICTCVHFQYLPALHRCLNIGEKRHPCPVGPDTHLSCKGVCNSVVRKLHLRSQPSHPIVVWCVDWLNSNQQQQLVPSDLVALHAFRNRKRFCWLVNANYS